VGHLFGMYETMDIKVSHFNTIVYSIKNYFRPNMIKSTIVDLLHSVEIFKNIPADLIAKLSDSLQTISYKSGTPIINKGEEGDSMFIILNGQVKIHDDEHVVATMESGNYFGEFSLLDSAPRSMSVTAVNDVTTVSVQRELFFKILQNQPDVSQKIISTLTKRLRKQNESLINQFKTRESELTRLVKERTLELQLMNEEISIKNKEITDNVNYARRIQSAILPDIGIIQQTFSQSFILYLPKDIVSGDFFSFYKKENYAIIITADCTGHGITGAFLSIIGSSLLNQIINDRNIIDPGKILDHLHEDMIEVLNQRNNESTDGMDVAVCKIDFEKNSLSFAGANRPLWLIRNNEIIILSPDKFPVGGLQIFHNSTFNESEITFLQNDTFYIFTDGYADQFGGTDGKKLMTKKFKEILLSIQSMDMPAQKNYLIEYFQKWKESNDQVDDVLVIGIRL
jgi:CRP-like cAMP-binding protein